MSHTYSRSGAAGPRHVWWLLVNPNRSHRILIRTLGECRSCWPHLTGIAFLSLLSLPLTLLYPLPLKIVLDSVLGSLPLPAWTPWILSPASLHRTALALAIFLLLAVAVLVNLQGLLAWWLQTYTGEKLVWDFRAHLLNHVQRLPLVFHDHYGATDSVYRIQHDAASIQYVTIQGLVPLATSFFTLLGMVLVTARMDRELALVALLIIPVLSLLSVGCSRIVRRRSQMIKGLDSSAMAVIQEVIGSIRVVKAFGGEGREHARFVRRSGERMSEQVRLAFQQALFSVLIGLTIAGGTAATLYIGVHHVRAGQLTVGSLIMIMAYVAQVYQPLQTLSTKSSELETWLASLERVFALLDQEPEIAEDRQAQPLVRARGEFEFREVSFRYAGSARGLERISFRIPAGARVGIVGSTGAGKTTLLNLLMRFYDPNEGVVLLDGVDLRKYRIRDLRRQFGVVLQEPVLFAASIAENIAYGKPESSDQEIVAAATAAASDEFIRGLPQGYDTQAGERGARISGGERQRISLARAFLRDSPILILDEPTSSVDFDTETGIIEATERLMAGRTTFMIAHRLHTLKSCDLILVLDHGRLVEVRECHPQASSQAAVL